MTLGNIRNILRQAKELGTIEWIYFEGGEPFLYYPILVRAVREAAEMGFQVGIVSNAYWATSLEDALEWLRPFAASVQDLSFSSDLFHYGEEMSQQAMDAQAAAVQLGIPTCVISIATPEHADAGAATGQLPNGESGVMFRGRAADQLAQDAGRSPWDELTECPHEDLRGPERAHLDPLGNLHICQGISLGNLFQTPLVEICQSYDAAEHPIAAPLLDGGPAELARRYRVSRDTKYADACHLCYETRKSLRDRFPEILTPDQMYGVMEDSERSPMR
jgi:MoaA/NifB/PqqE/SkfB family radical SAM enzyme